MLIVARDAARQRTLQFSGPWTRDVTKYTRSPLEDSLLFGPSPWKVLATTYEQKGS